MTIVNVRSVVHFVGALAMQDVVSDVENIDNNGQAWLFTLIIVMGKLLFLYRVLLCWWHT